MVSSSHSSRSLDRNGCESSIDDGLEDIWKEMTVALEYSKDVGGDTIEQTESQKGECVHFIIVKEDLGHVCQLCGLVEKRIETTFDYQWVKDSTSNTSESANMGRETKNGSRFGIVRKKKKASCRRSAVRRSNYLAAMLQALSTSDLESQSKIVARRQSDIAGPFSAIKDTDYLAARFQALSTSTSDG